VTLAGQKAGLKVLAKICCYPSEARLLTRSFQRLFWGEQPPFTSIGRGGRYFFGVKKSNARRSTPNLQRPTQPKTEGRISWPVAFTLVALVIAAVVVAIFFRLESWPTRTAQQGTAELERLGKDLRAAFIDIAHLQPRITINSRVYLEQTTPTSELTILSRRVEVEHELQHTWAGSSKHVKLHGTFAVKAGFDLRQDFSIDVRPEEIVVQLPHAQILGVEQEQVEVLALENGLWNRISAADLDAELATLPQLARRKAAESGLAAEAESALQKQLDARIHAPQPLRVTFVDPVRKD
jgi:hypothetical protein